MADKKSFNDDEITDPGIQKPRTQPARTAPAAPAPRAPEGKMPDLGAASALMNDPEITEIMINDVRNIIVERAGKMLVAPAAIDSLEELGRITRNLLDSVGRALTPEHPFVDTMLPDGSRAHIIGPPLTQNGPCITIRKFPARKFALEDLVAHGMLDRRMDYLLRACVLGKLNILISGGTSSGKTTLLNALIALIPKSERIVTIEDTPELAVYQPNSVRLQTKLATGTSPAVTPRDLTVNALRMRPDRIIIGESRREEAFDILQAMNTGHEGSMTTLHSNSTKDAIARFETLCLLANSQLPLQAIRRQISSAIDVIVQLKRFRDGQRRIVAITEVTGIEGGDTVTQQDIFLFDHEPGEFKCSGFVPSFLDRLKDSGIDIPHTFFA
ncbi:MAG: ATPase, T2SS/T4P/T4SS family [Oligoflexia bacterium]|nr:ATPase, T2SS/T4P/T4SS family [Oligoflexia bacterium]